MGTRSVVARPMGDGFEGRYCHWDGYPSGVGASLWGAFHGRFGGDVEAMRSYLVDDELVGWSQLAGVDWSQDKGWYESHGPEVPCADCSLPLWQHYAQYYPEGGPSDPMVNGKRRAGLLVPSETLQLGHGHQAPNVVTGPQSYTCRGESGDQMIYSDGDDGGTEWAYVLTDAALFIFERRYGSVVEDQGHGTGMFGMGASDTDAGGWWCPVALLPWGGEVPNWGQLDQGAAAVTA